MLHTPILPPPLKLVELGTVGSTNDHAKNLAKNGYPAWTAVWAHEQTQGRGRQGNVWSSLPGNLFMSVLLRPKTSAARIGQLSFLCGVAVANVLESFLPAGNAVHLKWPNDVLLNGKKLAGILLETEHQGVQTTPWVVAGIGVNITDAPAGAVSLRHVGVTSYDAGHLLEFICTELYMLVKKWEKGGFQDIRQAWLSRAWKLGEPISARLPKETLTGTFEGLDQMGSLLLRMQDGSERMIVSGEVYI